MYGRMEEADALIDNLIRDKVCTKPFEILTHYVLHLFTEIKLFE